MIHECFMLLADIMQRWQQRIAKTLELFATELCGSTFEKAPPCTRRQKTGKMRIRGFLFTEQLALPQSCQPCTFLILTPSKQSIQYIVKVLAMALRITTLSQP